MEGARTGEAATTLRLRLGNERLPLGYAADGDRIYLVARERSARWPVAVLREGLAVVETPDGPRTTSPRLITDPAEKERVLELFRARYGPEGFARWYEHPARILELRSTEEGRAIAPAYAEWLRDEFDNVADDYDRHITGNRMNLLLRNRSLERLSREFAGARHLLEIGCGSGMETMPLLLEGHEILCIDISPRMLEVVRRKAKEAGVAERLRTERRAARDVGGLLKELGAGSLDGAYSTYGALNCEEDLSALPPHLAELLGPRGRFIAGVYNRWCLFELAGYGLTGRPRRALGRTQRPVPVGASRFCVDIYAYSAWEFERLFRPWFVPRDLEGVPAILPPSDLSGYAEKLSRHFEMLARWDRRWGLRWPFRALGDHFLVTFDRAGAG